MQYNNFRQQQRNFNQPGNVNQPMGNRGQPNVWEAQNYANQSRFQTVNNGQKNNHGVLSRLDQSKPISNLNVGAAARLGPKVNEAPGRSNTGSSLSKPAPITAPDRSIANATPNRPAPITATSRPSPVTTPRSTNNVNSKPTPITAPKPTPITAPKPTPITAPKPTPITAPKPTPITAPKPTPMATPKPTPMAAPQSKGINRNMNDSTPKSNVAQPTKRAVYQSPDRSKLNNHPNACVTQSTPMVSNKQNQGMFKMTPSSQSNTRFSHRAGEDRNQSAYNTPAVNKKDKVEAKPEDKTPISIRLGPKNVGTVDVEKNQNNNQNTNQNDNQNTNQNNNQKGGKSAKSRLGGNETENRGKNRQQNEGRGYGREGGRPRGSYSQARMWERLYELQEEQYDLEPLDTSEKKFNAQSRLFIGSLSRDMKQEELEEMFKKYGEVDQIFHNKEGAYAFINLDYRSNAEKAVRELNGTKVHGRNILIRFAAITTGVKVKNLSPVVTNELLHKAFSVFGDVEMCRIVVDDRGKPTGDGLVIFSEKRSAVMAYKKCQEESFFLTSSIRPVIVDPYETRDDEDGFPEANIIKNELYRKERSVGPRFADLNSFESDYGRRWKQLFDIYKEKKTALENDLKAEMEALEVKMALVVHQQETDKLRRELAMREREAYELQKGLGNYENTLRPTQLTNSEEFDRYGTNTGVKRSHDYYEGGNQLIERLEYQQRDEQSTKGKDKDNVQAQNYDSYYNNGGTDGTQFGNQQQRSYANVLSGVSGASYENSGGKDAATQDTKDNSSGYQNTSGFAKMSQRSNASFDETYEAPSKRGRY